jgi:hypothetical protein
VFLEILFGVAEIELSFGCKHFKKINRQSPFALMSSGRVNAD